MIREIKILDSGIDRYIIDPETINLGRMYDNEADTISIIRPDAEKNSICTMIITDMNGKVIDHIIMRDNTYKITNAISLNSLVQIGFSFSRADGYIKGSEIILGKFLPASKPDGFIPTEPEQKKNIDYLISYGFTNSRLNGNSLEFFNMNGDKVVSFDLSPFTQVQSDLGEKDENAETFVKGKKTSNLENDSGFITKSVNDLENYYNKENTYSKEQVVEQVKTEVAKITATQIRNKEPNLVIEVTGDNFQTIASQYIVDNYGRQPQEFDGLYLTFTDHDNQVVEYAYHNGAWINVGFDKVNLSNYMDLTTEQRVKGRKVFEDETAFENRVDFENGIVANNSTLTTTDIAKDMVTQYSADEIVRETGTGEQKQTYNYKFPDKSGTLVTDEDIAYMEYAPVVELTPNTATNGILSDDDYDNLIDHDDVRIKLNNEYYDLMNDKSVQGIRSYVHKGWNDDQDKSINITLSTKSWTLKNGRNNTFEHIIKVSGNSDDNSEAYEFMFLFVSSKSTAVTTQSQLMNLIGSDTQLPVSGWRKTNGSYFPVIYIKGGNTYYYLNQATGLSLAGVTSLGNYSIIDEVK